MTPEEIRARDRRWTQGVQPLLTALVLGRVLPAMEAAGFPMMGAGKALRTEAEQQALYAKGRTVPGPDVSAARPMGRIVTQADGVRLRSNHQAHPDGSGHAIDCCFLIDADQDGEVDDPTWSALRPWALYGAVVEEVAKALDLRVVWGGRWRAYDGPHVELLG